LLRSQELFVDIATVVCMGVKDVQDCTVPVFVPAGSDYLAGHFSCIVPHGLLSPGVIPVGVKNYRDVFN